MPKQTETSNSQFNKVIDARNLSYNDLFMNTNFSLSHKDSEGLLRDRSRDKK
jgi:hypothetical protein